MTPTGLQHPPSPSTPPPPALCPQPVPLLRLPRGAARPLQGRGAVGVSVARTRWRGAPRPPRRWRCAERESAGLHSRSRGLRRDLCGRKEAGEMRLSRICLMQRFLHIPQRLASLRGARLGCRGAVSGVPRRASPGAPVLGHDAGRGIKISHVTGVRRCVPQAGWHQPRGRGRGGSRSRASSGVLLAHRVQALLSVGRAGGHSPHNHGAAAPAGSRGEPGTAEMLGLARQRGSARLSDGAKPARAWPLPAAWVSGTTPPPPVPAVCFPGCAASSAHTSAVFRADLFGKFYFPCFPYGETEAGGKTPVPTVEQGSPGSHRWMQQWFVGG